MKASFTPSEGWHGSSTGTLNLEIAPGGSNALKFSGNGHVVGASDERDGEGKGKGKGKGKGEEK